ncbi:MAG: hypothetical protein WBQ94_03680 [Terracidiphilus sp.]
MSQHYTGATVEASEWCRKCGKNTPHRIDDRRVGPCIPCMNALPGIAPGGLPAPAEQEDMFK